MDITVPGNATVDEKEQKKVDKYPYLPGTISTRLLSFIEIQLTSFDIACTHRDRQIHIIPYNEVIVAPLKALRVIK